MPQQGKLDPAVSLVLKNFGEAKPYHDQYVGEVERLYRAYRGQVERRSEAASWTSQYHPPYILQMIESMVSSIEDPTPKVRTKPRPKLGDDIEKAINSAKTLQYTIDYALDLDRWAEKQRAWILQALICKMTVVKTYWDSGSRPKPSLQYRSNTIQGPMGPIDTVPQLMEVPGEENYDGPCVEVRDVRDFLWPESATSVDSAPWVIDRVWIPAESAKAYAASYGVQVEALDSSFFTPSTNERENYLGNINKNRTKNLIPVVERWSDDRVITILNDKILLRDDPNPFWHGKKPFVVTSAMPEPFQITGISVVEIVDHLQEMLWSLQNQRIDSLRLMSNMIMLARADLADLDMFEWAPGAIWPVEDASQFKPLEINPAIATMTLEAEALIKADLRDIPGGDLFSGGAQSQVLDSNTATEASLVSSIAQRLVLARKQQFRHAAGRIIEQVGSNCQQFYREPQLIEIVGPGADPTFLQVNPEDIQCRCDYIVEVNDESLIRQERQASYTSLMTTMANTAPWMMQSGVQPNWEQLWKDAIEQGWDVGDASRYLKPFAPPGQAPGQLPPGQDPNQPQGVTSPTATGPQQPSDSASLNVGSQMQQMLAQQGGPNNGASY